VSNLQDYFLATARREAAVQQRNYASTLVDLERVRERLAEIKSQHEPLAKLLEAPMSERDRLYAAAFYVVVGRMPTPKEEPRG
jgi:hypothetical protein